MGFLTFLLLWISGVLHRRPGAACAAKKMIPRRDRRRRRAGCRSVRSETFVDSLGGLFVRLRRRGLCRGSGAGNVVGLSTSRRMWTSCGRCAGSPSLPTPLAGVDKTVGVHSIAHTRARGRSDHLSGGIWKIKDFPHTRLCAALRRF